MSAAKVFSKLRYHVFVCADAGEFCGCDAHGGPELVGELRKRLVQRRLMPYVKVTLMNCNQPGAQGPVVVVHPDGIWYDGLTAEDLDEFVETQLVQGAPLERRLMPDGLRTGHFAV